MAKRTCARGLVSCGVILVGSSLCMPPAILLRAAGAGGEEARKIAFDDKAALAGWTVTGDVAIDAAKARGGSGGALRVGPGGKAALTLRDRDESGKVELWVYDDGTTPADPKAHRVGPRWGLVQRDGRVLAAGILYANYLGGAEGYTATACDGRAWFDQLFWLGVRRGKAAWHLKLTDFRPPGAVRGGGARVSRGCA